MSPHRDRSRRALRATGVVALAGLLVWVASWLTTRGDTATVEELSPLAPSGAEVALGVATVPLTLLGVFVTLWVALLVAERLGVGIAVLRARLRH